MGKPRMILLIRHAQSEGNKNRDIHQYIPDHRVKLTQDGVQQAEDAGRRLRSMLKPDDTIQFFTSPYRRTRETTEGILRTLTTDDPEQGPSPFPLHKIKVYEEPRLREQDFGNFQPCSAEMERMWQERADYGHFFYRIPNGESAADAYDRVSGFNESLWRQFGDSDFPSVCVLVTHGLMTRIFLMKWYHWSMEYFEDLRNVNHCEFIVMKQNPENGKYILQNELRTWSDLKRRVSSQNMSGSAKTEKKASVPAPNRIWGGCVNGCNHAHMNFPRQPRRQNTQDFLGSHPQPPANSNEQNDHPTASQEAENTQGKSRKSISSKSNNASGANPAQRANTSTSVGNRENEPINTVLTPLNSAANEEADAIDVESPESEGDGVDGSDADADADSSSPISASPKRSAPLPHRHNRSLHRPTLLSQMGRDFGGSKSGIGSPADISDEADESDYFDTNIHQLPKRMSRSEASRSALSMIDEGITVAPNGSSKGRIGSGKGRKQTITKLEEEWKEDSGMASGKRADALGDVDENEVEEMKEKDRKSLSEVY